MSYWRTARQYSTPETEEQSAVPAAELEAFSVVFVLTKNEEDTHYLLF